LKKILVIMLVLCTCLSGTAQAFELESIGPETSFLDSLKRDVTGDINYLRGIAESYKEKYVVTEEQYIDIASIDNFYADLSAPLTLSELDSGKLAFNTDKIYKTGLKKELNLFKIIGGLSGCRATFEPVCYFRIYRNIALVGGYSRYEKTYQDADAAYWQYICKVEDMTKEVVPYETRLAYLDKTRQMYSNMDSDNRFKVFLLVDGEINSIWERSDAE